MKIIFVQPNIPIYRVPFYSLLNKKFNDQMEVWASVDIYGKTTNSGFNYKWSKQLGGIIGIKDKIEYQKGWNSIRFNKSDIIVISGGPRCISNIFLLLKAKLIGSKTVWWGHYKSTKTKKIGLFIRLQLMKLNNYVLFYTEKEKDSFLSTYLNPSFTPFFLNNSIDTKTIKQFRISYDYNKRKNNLLFIGRLVKKSNLDLLIESLKNLDSMTLHVIGDGPSFKDFKDLSIKLAVEKKIVFYGSITSENKIADIANKSSMFVYPGAVGLSLIHAMTYGLPSIINTSIPNGPEGAYFENNSNGIALQKSDSTSLAEIINKINEKDQLTFYSSNCIKLIDEKFSIELMVKNFQKMITTKT